MWELETYNSWDLPFAKSVTINGTDSLSANLPLSNYLLSVDPSAYFSVIFVEQDIRPASIDPTPETYINYTNYGGSTNLLYGYWLNLTLSINSTNVY